MQKCLPKVDLLLNKCNGLWESKEVTSRNGKSLGLKSAVHGPEVMWLSVAQSSAISNWDNSTYSMRVWWKLRTFGDTLFVLQLHFMDSASGLGVQTSRFSSPTAWAEIQLCHLLDIWPGVCFPTLFLIVLICYPRIMYLPHRVILKWTNVCKVVGIISNTLKIFVKKIHHSPQSN